ncbi:MAG TPA: hypothetical protein DCP25_15510 [Chloroflexi bacterium]|nr:hypothetical protein [Chloroflexota bacterium]
MRLERRVRLQTWGGGRLAPLESRSTPTLIRGHVIESAAELGSIVDQWDELAVEASEPFCSPAWMLAWWRNAAPADAALRAVAVLDGRELVGVAPMFAQRGTSGLARYALLASPMSLRAAPLARRGREQEAAAAIAEALAMASPYPDIVTFAGIGQISSWPSLLQRAWPGSRRPLLFEEQTIPAPYVSLEGRSFDEWFASKSPNFRQQIRRRRRQLEAAGAVFRLAAADEVVRDLRAFAALHHARWRPRGGSGVLDQNVERMLEDVAPVLAANGRMRVFAIDVEDRPISVQIFVGTGGEFSYWLGGFDAAWSAQQPSMQGLVAAIEHAFHAGDGVLDLGGGGPPYKYRLANEEVLLEWSTLVLPGARFLLARGAVAARTTRRSISKRLPRETRHRLRRVRSALRRTDRPRRADR